MQDNQNPQGGAQYNQDLVSQPVMERVSDDPGESIRRRLETEQMIKSGANWFFWIAALSVINSILVLSGTEWNFIIGLGVTQIIEVLAMGVSQTYATNTPLYIAMGLNILISGVFVLIGYYARQKREYVFIAGMALYVVDGSLFLMAFDLLGLGFHAFALFMIYKGYSAIGKLKELQPPPPQPGIPDGVPKEIVK